MSAALDIINRIRYGNRTPQKSGERILWNASPTSVTFQHAAIPYEIPPNGPGKISGEKNVRTHDGILKVYDVHGIDPQQTKAARQAVKGAAKAGISEAEALASFPKVVVINSLAIVEHAIKKLAPRGVTLLTGDAEVDAELKSAAEAAWIEFRKKECQDLLDRYDAKKAVFYAQPRNANQPPPPMTARENDAFVWIADYNLGQVGGGGKKHVCQVYQCGFQHEDADVLVRHYMAIHPNYAAEAAESEDPEVIPPTKRGPGRPKKATN